jgi:Na+/H+ antiporter NhaC
MKKVRWIVYAGILIAIFLVRHYTGIISKSPTSDDYQFWSLVPAMLTLIICFAFREVIPALFVGIFAGGLISGKYNIVQEYLIPAIGSPEYGQILLVYLWCLGGLIGIWAKTGGARHFATWAGKKIVKDRKTAKFFAYLMGLLFHQGGTISTVLAGSTVKPICDEKRVSHEELSYIIDSTASPVATVIPFNVWPLYISGLVIGTTPLFIDKNAGIEFFFKAIPFNFYAIFALLFTLLMSWEKIPFYGKRMKAAMKRAEETGKLDRDGSNPLFSKELSVLSIPEGYKSSNVDFLVPIGTLLAVAIIPRFLLGKMYISEAFFLAALSGMIVALYRGMKLQKVMEGFIDGCKGVTVGAIILGLAVTLGKVSESLGTANYIIRTTSSIILPYLLPAIFLGICMFIAFSVGTSWGTYAVVFPIAMPLAYKINPDPFYILLCFAAVTGGATYGDQCSPISDTTILSSLATGADHMDHVFTQLPLATLAAGVAAVLYTIIAFFAF